MKIRHEENGMRTPCQECIFYDEGRCEFGRIEKYKELGKFENSEVQTFCNHARPQGWLKDQTFDEAKDRVVHENRIKYDLIIRIKAISDIYIAQKFIDNTLPPERIIYSFTNLSIKDVVATCSKLNYEFELLQITEEKDRNDLEFNRVTQPWYLTLEEDFSTNLINELNDRINNNLEQIVAVFGEQKMLMTMLAATLQQLNIRIEENNIVKISEGQKLCVRKFDGFDIGEYN